MNAGLRSRVVTASTLAPIILALVWFANVPVLTVFFCGVSLIGAHEWLRLCGVREPLVRAGFYIAVVLIAAGVVVYPQAAPWFLAFVVLYWFVLAYRTLLYWRADRPVWLLGKLVTGVLILSGGWVAAVWHKVLLNGAPYLLVSLLLIIWAADTGAYFAGRRFGKHKLSPRISPGKTVEGMLGGILGALLVSVVSGVFWLHLGGFRLFAWLCLVALVVVFSVIGDLVESTAKREAGMKDSGNLLPGHGGMLDRIDSLTAAAPMLAVGWMTLSLLRNP